MSQNQSVPTEHVRILVVDDSPPWRKWVVSFLSPLQQLQVIGEASDGLEAVQKAQVLRPDLILLDIGLPVLNGIEAARRISQVSHGSKVIFLTMESNSDVAKVALSNGALAYVLKRDAASELLPAIEAVLRGERFMSNGLRE